MNSKKARLTKKKATELFKKVFGSVTGIHSKDDKDTWCADYGTLSAECYIDHLGVLVLIVTFDCYANYWLYYNPENLEFDNKCYLENSYADQKDSAFEYMASHNLAVVSMKDLQQYGLEQINGEF